MSVRDINTFGVKAFGVNKLGVRMLGTAALLIFAITSYSCRPRRAEEITSDDLKIHASYLASDDLGGREIGTPGIVLAEKYIADQFTNSDLEPLPGEDDLFLEFPFETVRYDSESTNLTIQSDTISRVFGVDQGVRPFSFTGTGIIEGEVVFAGYGITAPEHNYDDYSDLDVAGKIVLIMRHEPNEKDESSVFAGAKHSSHALFVEKAKNARDHGAIGMLLYTDPLNHEANEDLRSLVLVRFPNTEEGRQFQDTIDSSIDFPAVHISREIARFLLEPLQIDPKELQQKIDTGESPSAYSIDSVSATLSVDMSPLVEEMPVRNVAAFVRGSDKRLREEWIIIGAHHDHIGSFSGIGDTIFNGADDNASGTSAVLELAEQIASLRPAPPRSIAFITFSAEEKGLFGSRALDKYDLIPMEKVGFMINLDMIGRNPHAAVTVIGDGFGVGVKTIMEEINSNHELPFLFSGKRYQAFSDNEIFRKNGIPFLMFFTGEHEDYHQPGDHAEKLDFFRMEAITKYVFDLVMDLASRESLPEFN